MTALTFVKAVKYREKLRLALDGTAGSGKTWTALIIACYLAELEGGRVAVIDSERSSARKYASDFDFDHLTLPDWSPHTYMGAVRSAVAAGYPVLVIDSFSHAWEGVLELKDNATARSKSKNSYTEGWREATPVHNELVDTVLRADAHVIATLRTKTEYVIDDGKPTKVGMKPIQRDGVDFEFDVVGDMTPENTMVISKTRCSQLAGQVIRKPDVRLAETLWAWLNDGEELLGRAEADAIREALNDAGQVARKAWLDQFGIKPDDLPAARRDEAMAFVASLDDHHANGAHGHDVGRTEPEPAPDTDDTPAAFTAQVLAIHAQKVFTPAGNAAPKGQKTKVIDRLRHGLVHAFTDGKARSFNDLTESQCSMLHDLLVDLDHDRVTFDHDDTGVEFQWQDGSHTSVLWDELEPEPVEAEPEVVPS